MSFDDLYERLVQVDLAQVPLFVVDTLRNPAQSPTAFILLIVAITTILALIIMVVILVFLATPEEGDDVEDAPSREELRRQERIEMARERVVADERRRKWQPLVTLVWVTVVAAVWVVGGFASRPDAVCVSCHREDSGHVWRLDRSTATVDPHGGVRCASCHETPNLALSVTVAVPGRAMHYVGGAIAPRYAEDYNVPARNRSCSACHSDTLAGTITNRDRGLRMSHKEPLARGALCVDCHAVRAVSGTVDRYTVGMDPCIRCHDEEIASAECSYCHVGDVGLAVQSKGSFKAQSHEIDCSGCHALTTCDACHGIRLPHTTPFMGAGHAREAVEDIWYNGGRTCRGCHTDARRPCSRCHGGTFPSHPPTYMIEGHKNADPYSNGCDECHIYRAWVTGRNFCGNCHPKWAQPIQR